MKKKGCKIGNRIRNVEIIKKLQGDLGKFIYNIEDISNFEIKEQGFQ